MLGKGERICPVCGRKLELTAPTMLTGGSAENRLQRTVCSLLPYTVYPHDDHRIVRTRRGKNPVRKTVGSMERCISRDGLSLYNRLLVFHCMECKSRLSLNFNFIPLTDYLLIALVLLFIPMFFLRAILYIWLGLLVLLIAAPVGCLIYIKRNLSNFVPVNELDALMTPVTRLSLSPEGLKKRWIHESNIFTVELSQQKFHLYLAEKDKKVLKFSVCGYIEDKKRFAELLEKSGLQKLELSFEGKPAGTAAVLNYSKPE